MKAKIRIPLQQYAFVELEVEDKSLTEIKQIADEMTMLVTEENEGHNTMEWSRVRDTYLKEGELDITDFEACNKWQKFVINEIKKTINKLDK